MLLGHFTIGTGNEHVIVLHDWFSDCSSYSSLLPYLNVEQFTYVFCDLRGYGKSKDIQGEYSLYEACGDVLTLADHLQWDNFHLVGHSMSGMIVQRLALDAQNKVKSVVAITPVSAAGSRAPEEVMFFLKDAAQSNDASARQIASLMTGGQYERGFIDYKVKHWREISKEEARVSYLHMFSDNDFSKEVIGLKIPFLVIAGAHDAESYSAAALTGTFLNWYPHAELIVFPTCGHYPMQETPVRLVETIEKYFISRKK